MARELTFRGGVQGSNLIDSAPGQGDGVFAYKAPGDSAACDMWFCGGNADYGDQPGWLKV